MASTPFVLRFYCDNKSTVDLSQLQESQAYRDSTPIRTQRHNSAKRLAVAHIPDTDQCNTYAQSSGSSGTTGEQELTIQPNESCKPSITKAIVRQKLRQRITPQPKGSSGEHQGLYIWQLPSAQQEGKPQFSSPPVVFSYSTYNCTYLCTPFTTTAPLLDPSYYNHSCLLSSYVQLLQSTWGYAHEAATDRPLHEALQDTRDHHLKTRTSRIITIPNTHTTVAESGKVKACGDGGVIGVLVLRKLQRASGRGFPLLQGFSLYVGQMVPTRHIGIGIASQLPI